MTLTETNHRCLERLALAIAVLNLASVRILFANEWSFYFDPWFLLCIVLPAFVIALPLLPFLIPSSGSSSTSKSEVVWLVFTFAAMIGFELIWCAKIAFTIFCRDRFGTFYWPWEQREFKLQVLDSWNLSARMWTDIFQQSIPVQPLVREVPGLALVIIMCF